MFKVSFKDFLELFVMLFLLGVNSLYPRTKEVLHAVGNEVIIIVDECIKTSRRGVFCPQRKQNNKQTIYLEGIFPLQRR